MKRFQRKSSALALLAILFAAGSLMNWHQAVAQNSDPGSAPVHLVSPIPLPVTGVLGISGPVTVTTATALPVTGSVAITANQPTSPLFTRELSKMAAYNVELVCRPFSVNDLSAASKCSHNDAGGVTPYTVPAGSSLVITNADLRQFSAVLASWNLVVAFPNGTTTSRLIWDIPKNPNADPSALYQVEYPTGIVIPSGAQLSILVAQAQLVGSFLGLHGYLTAN